MLCLLVLAALTGCSTARKAEQSEEDAFYAAFPPVTLSEDVIHSPDGDMTARLPQNWVTLDVNRLESPQVFTMACNPDYTLSLVFSEVPVDNSAKAGFNQGGLRGLAEASFQRRLRRSNGRARMVADLEEFAIGTRKFSAYTYSTDSLRTLTRVAIFYTNFHLYECSITHLAFNDHELPSPRTVQDIHQMVLATIEW